MNNDPPNLSSLKKRFSEPVNVTLQGEKGFEDIIVSIEMGRLSYVPSWPDVITISL